MSKHMIVVKRNLDSSVELFIDGRPISPKRSLKVFHHSPDGFNFGYGGSGPAQLALGILLELAPKRLAVEWHQDFKWKFLAGSVKDEKEVIIKWDDFEQFVIDHGRKWPIKKDEVIDEYKPKTKFAHITFAELKEDWDAAHVDIQFCEFALSHSVDVYMQGTKTVQERLDGNKNIIGAIEQEMKDRGLEDTLKKWVKPARKINVIPLPGWQKKE